MSWLLGPLAQHSRGGTGRSSRARTAWCWRIAVPTPVPTGVVHEHIELDGTYFNTWCLLVAFNGTHVVDWQWCDREKKIAYTQLLERIPPPDLVVMDGGGGLLGALAETWPDVPAQRCYFHLFRNVVRHTTRHPKLRAGREILDLTRALMRVSSQDEAARWLTEYAAWEARWNDFLAEGTYATDGTPPPRYVRASQTWWYTHPALRKVRYLYRTIIKNESLFTWLALEPTIRPRTTSPLEGGPNTAVKALLRNHRGLPPHHAQRAVDWLLNSLTEHPYDPWSLVRPEHLNPPPRPLPTQEPIGPALYDTAFSWEDGAGIQHGWAGRSH